MKLFGHVGLTLAAAYAADRAVRSRLVRSPSAQRSGAQAPGGDASMAPEKTAGPTPLHLDFRLVILGSLLPDLIDKPLGLWLAPELVNHGLRSFGHTVIVALAFLAVALLISRSRRRPSMAALAASSAGHLVLDQMWRQPAIALWPGLGWAFPEKAATLSDLPSSLFRGLLLFYREPPELAGAAVILLFLVVLWRSRAFLRFLRSGSAA